MTTNDIPAIRELAGAADRAPWTAHDDGLVWAERIGDPVSGSALIENAQFIAAARTHVPNLCDEVEQLRAELARADAQLIAANRRADGLHEQNAAAQNALRSLGQAYADLKTNNDELAAENARVRQDRDKALGELAGARGKLRAVERERDEAREDRDTKADIAKNRADIITDLGKALNAHTAVVEAAKAWVASSVAEFGRTGDALTDAVNALAKAEATR